MIAKSRPGPKSPKAAEYYTRLGSRCNHLANKARIIPPRTRSPSLAGPATFRQRVGAWSRLVRSNLIHAQNGGEFAVDPFFSATVLSMSEVPWERTASVNRSRRTRNVSGTSGNI